MNLIIDIGNTYAKLAVFEHNTLLEPVVHCPLADFGIPALKAMRCNYPATRSVIVSSVVGYDSVIIDWLEATFCTCVALSHTTPLAIANHYRSKTRLGNDRIAAAVGANTKYPNTNVLVIDIGTAITYDFVDSTNIYRGGNISPGLDIRYKALNAYTKKLPLLQKTHGIGPLIAQTTEEAIQHGVQYGVLFEIEGYIRTMADKYSDLQTVLTGGDSFFFAEKIKSTIFADPYLVLRGLNEILLFNVKHEAGICF